MGTKKTISRGADEDEERRNGRITLGHFSNPARTDGDTVSPSVFPTYRPGFGEPSRRKGSAARSSQ